MKSRRRFHQLKPEFLALNPAGLVPVLVDGAQVLTESRIINEYLEDAYAQPRLCPEGAYARAMPPAGSEGGQAVSA